MTELLDKLLGLAAKKETVSASCPPGAHSRTWTGRDWVRSARVPLTCAFPGTRKMSCVL